MGTWWGWLGSPFRPPRPSLAKLLVWLANRLKVLRKVVDVVAAVDVDEVDLVCFRSPFFFLSRFLCRSTRLKLRQPSRMQTAPYW